MEYGWEFKKSITHESEIHRKENIQQSYREVFLTLRKVEREKKDFWYARKAYMNSHVHKQKTLVGDFHLIWNISMSASQLLS